MAMRRFFVEELNRSSATVEIGDDEFYHLKKVLRLERGGKVSVFNGRGLEAEGIIESMHRDSALIRIVDIHPGRKESPFSIVLLQALLKGERMDLIVQKTTELGINCIYIFSSSRTVPMPRGNLKGRLRRWRKIAIEAAKQCGRAVVPEIRWKDTMKEALSEVSHPLRFILWEEERRRGLREAVEGVSGDGCAVCIGPEGGFTEEEMGMAFDSGFVPVSLGKRILRSETSAIVVTALLQYRFGDMG